MAVRTMLMVMVALIAVVTTAHAGQAQRRAVKSTPDPAVAEKNKKDGEAFLAENKAREGVVTLESGLQYKIQRAGDGAKPSLDDTVLIEFRGSLIDGTDFYNTYTRGQPSAFVVRQAIKGLQEALPRMSAGSKWQLFVPPHLAYGARGAGGAIGPNATLIFEAELVAIKAQPSKTVPTDATLTGIEVSFKVDPRLTRGLYMGDRWISPATYTPINQGKTSTIEASAKGLDARGKRVKISPEWIAADPKMVEVKAGRDNEVMITVKRAGESKLRIVSAGITKELAIKAAKQGNAIAVEIAQ